MFRTLFSRQTKTETPAPAAEVKADVSTLSAPEPWLFDLLDAAPASSGVRVSPQTAERCPAVRRAIEAVAGTIGTLPCRLYETAAHGAVSAIEGHPLADLLSLDVNGWTPAGSFFEQLTRDCLLNGNAFAWISRSSDGSPIELLRLRPGDVTAEADVNPLNPPIYRLQGREISRESLLHLKAPSLDGVNGVSPVVASREAIATAMAIEAHVGRLFARGGRPSGVIAIPGKVAPDALARLRAAWQSAHGGANSGGTAVLDNGAEFKPVTMTSVDAQLLELWQHSIDEIARVFGVPPHLLFSLQRATWSNAGEMGASFLRFGLSRWLRAWEGELNAKLIASEDRRRLSIEFDADSLIASDLAARADAYSTLISARVLTPNEARSREGLPPKPGGDELVNPFTTSATTSTDQTGGNGNG